MEEENEEHSEHSDQEPQPPVIVLDNGSGYLKAGFSNQKEPDLSIPSLIGRQILVYGQKVDLNLIKEAKTVRDKKKLVKQMVLEKHMKPIMIGDEVLPFRNLLELKHPMSEGIIQDPEDLKLLWEYCFKKLEVDDKLEDQKVIITEAPLNPLSNKIKMCEILFENFGVGALNIEPQAKCTMFSEGLTDGVVLDSGDGVTHCIPVSEGYILNDSIQRMDIAGREVTNYLVRLLQLKGYFFNSSADFELIREIKEKMCFISNDILGDRELERTSTYYNSFYLLPDKTRVMISNEKFEAPEILFEPYLIGKEYPGVHELVNAAINSSPMDCRKKLYGGIVLSGANTLFPGFASRLEREMKDIFRKEKLKNTEDKTIKMYINVIDNPKRKFSVFIGASIIGNNYNNINSDGDPNPYWITRDEWLDCEENSVYTKENLIKAKCQNYFQNNIS